MRLKTDCFNVCCYSVLISLNKHKNFVNDEKMFQKFRVTLGVVDGM